MRETTRFTMNFGLYTGAILIVVIMIFHFFGRTHFPGDQTSWINSAILAFMMIKSGKKYKQEYFNNNLSISGAIRYTVKLGIFTSIVLASFAYLYYGKIAPQAISNFIDYMAFALSESPNLSEDQKTLMIDLYRTNLNAGVMTFVTLLCQLFAALVIGVFSSVFIRTPHFHKNIKNEY